MCPINGNSANIRNQNMESLVVGIENNNEIVITKTKKNIAELANINLRIRYYTNYINQYWNSDEQKYKNKVRIYFNDLGEIYENLPKFIKKENEISSNNCCWKTIEYLSSPIVLLTGISIRVAQRYFSIAVVSEQSIIGKTFIEQLEILGKGMWESLKIPENYAMAGVDTLTSYFLSYYPFGLKSIIDLLPSNQLTQKKELDEYLPLEIIIKKLEKHLELKEYEKLNKINSNLDKLCTNLSTIIKKHDVINHIKDELKNIDFNDEFTFAKFNSLISAEISNDFLKELLNELSELSKTDLKNEDYSIKEIIKNSLSNTNFFLTTLLINHLVITASSAYTAETLTWESYKEDIVSINNIISTIVRATVMRFVNECFIKNALNTIFEPVKNYFCPQNNDHTLLQSFKNWVKNQNELSQLGVFIVSFLFISAITNAIKTYAADVTQNKGDWKKAWIQFKETFPKLGMVLSALGVTSSDLYNLTNKMKPAFKLIYKQEEQQKIIDEVLSELPNIINQANGNAASDGRDFLTRRINGHINNINEWDENDVQDINNSDREYLIPNNNRNHDRSLIQCVTI